MDDLTRMAIEHACERLVIRYTHAVDLHAREGLAAVFSDDAVVEVNGQSLRGSDIINGPASATGQLMRHVCTNILIEVTGDSTATGTSYLVAYVQPADDANLGLPVVLGHYHDTFQRTPDGWRIVKRSFDAILRRPS